MIRDVDLVSYLPDFMKNYQEPVAALEAENPEFYAVWEATDRILYNRFIETADEYGISRYEKMLGIYPSEEETLESRRAMVRARWFSSLPYTWRMLLQKLTAICGDTGFTVSNDFNDNGYTITLMTYFRDFEEIEDELKRILYGMVPCNIVLECLNMTYSTVELTVYAGCGILSTYKSPLIVENFDATWETTQTINVGVGGLPSYTPEAIFERLAETAKVPASEVFVGVGQHAREIRPEVIKEE